MSKKKQSVTEVGIYTKNRGNIKVLSGVSPDERTLDRLVMVDGRSVAHPVESRGFAKRNGKRSRVYTCVKLGVALCSDSQLRKNGCRVMVLADGFELPPDIFEAQELPANPPKESDGQDEDPMRVLLATGEAEAIVPNKGFRCGKESFDTLEEARAAQAKGAITTLLNRYVDRDGSVDVEAAITDLRTCKEAWIEAIRRL